MKYVYLKYKDINGNVGDIKFDGIDYKYNYWAYPEDQEKSSGEPISQSLFTQSRDISVPIIKFEFKRGLDIGSKGEDVGHLQTMLARDKEIYPEGLVTNYFGKLTQTAVKKFQLKYGLATETSPGYGYVGPLTRKKLNELQTSENYLEGNYFSPNESESELRAQLEILLKRLEILMKLASL